MLDALKFAMTTNTTLGKYDLKHNSMEEEGVEFLCGIIGEAKHVNQIALSEWISGEAADQLATALAANKPAKGGKKGKKKKK